MKRLSHKIAVGLLATSVTLSSVNANSAAFPETTGVVSSTHQNIVSLNDVEALGKSLSTVMEYLKDPKSVLFLVLEAKEKGLHLNIKYEELKLEYAKLKSESLVLEAENIALESQKEEKKVEKLSIKQKIKKWVAKIDATKVITTIAGGIITLLIMLLK